jgi:hypothetical protein
LQLGRGDDAWWPYDHRGEGYPGEPRVSRHQATVTMELTGPIIVADGDGEGHMSWNGTRIAQGMATPDSEPRPAAERPPAPFVGHTAVEYAGVSHGHTQLDDGTTQGHVPHDFIMRQPPDIE